MVSMPERRPWRRVLVLVARGHPRSLLSIAIGLIVMAALPGAWRIATRLLIGWDVGIGLYLLAAYELIWRSDVTRMRRRAALYDEGALTILVLTVGAALASLGAIIAELGVSHGVSGRRPSLRSRPRPSGSPGRSSTPSSRCIMPTSSTATVPARPAGSRFRAARSRTIGTSFISPSWSA